MIDESRDLSGDYLKAGWRHRFRNSVIATLLFDFAIALFLFGSAASAYWTLEFVRPEYIRDLGDLATIVVTVAVATAFLLHSLRQNYVARFLGAFRRLGPAVAFGVVAYALGIILCEQTGIAPPIEEWAFNSTETVRFAWIYTGVAVIVLLAAKWLIGALVRLQQSDVEVTGPYSLVLYLRPIWPLFVLVAYVSGLIWAERSGYGPALTIETLTSGEFLKFITLYTLAFLSVPVLLYLLWWLSGHIVAFVVAVVRWIGNTEQWRRLWGARLSDADFEAALLEARAIKEKVRTQQIIQRGKEAEERIRQRDEEIATFGLLVATLLWYAPWVMAIAQALSFVTSYLGVRIYLGLRQENVEWFRLDIPTPQFLGFAEPSYSINFMSNDVIASGASAVMALIIWGFSTLAIGRVRKNDPVPPAAPVLIIFFGALSTYTAFIMWNGELATREELLAAHRETASYLAVTEDEDRRLLVNTRRNADALQQALDVEVEGLRASVLRGHLLDLQTQLDDQNQNFARIQKLKYLLDNGVGYYETFLNCEIENGCLSNLAGRGEVAAELEKHIEVFKSNRQTWDALEQSRSRYAVLARDAAQIAVSELGAQRTESAIDAIAELREMSIAMQAEDPSVVLDGVKARLSIPISQEAPSESQRTALENLQREIAKNLETVTELDEIWDQRALELPPEIRIDEVGLVIGQDSTVLKQVVATLDEIIDEREVMKNGIRRRLLAIQEDVLNAGQAGQLIPSANAFQSEINETRDQIRSLAVLELKPVSAKQDLIASESGKTGLQPVPLDAAFPAVPEFVRTPLALLILHSAHLSVVPLMIQLMLDFGYTLSIVIVVSQLRSRRDRPGEVV